MIEFLPAEDAFRDEKGVVKGGLFAVPHKPESDRLINDRRPLNIGEKRLNWCALPSGVMLNQLILADHQSVRASGDDLGNSFYLIRHLDAWLPRNCFGHAIRGKKITWLNLEPNRLYYPSFKVVCMGGTNGVDIAQATHEGVLRAANCLRPEQTLVYGKLFPPSDTLEGLYIDDHLVFQVVDKNKHRLREPYPDEHLLAASRDRYSELGLPRSEKKAFEKQYTVKAWGTEVCSATGRVGCPLKKLRQIEELTSQLVLHRYATKKAWQKLIGLFVHPFMHRRECMSIFHHTYMHTDSLPDGCSRKIPQYVQDELITAALLLPVACSNVRLPVSVKVPATDASLGGGGRASTLTSKTFATALYRYGETKGEYTRLDWSCSPLPPESSMQKAPVPIVDSPMKHHWTTTQSCKFRQKQHINLLELEMLRAEMKARVNAGGGRCRCINLCDSRVVVGAFAKGRSSSKSLSHGLRSCLPWLIAGDLQLVNLWVNLWVATDKNPADFPSRFKDIPPPEFASNDPLLDSAVLQGCKLKGPRQSRISWSKRLGLGKLIP